MSALQVVRQEAFDDTEFRIIEQNGQEWFTAEDIGKALEFSEPRRTVLNLFNRTRDEFEGLQRVIKLMTRCRDGRTRTIPYTVFNPQGAYLLAILARTPKSKALRRWLSKFMAHDLNRLRDLLGGLQDQVRRQEERILRLRGKLRVAVRERKRLQKSPPAQAPYQFQSGDVVRLNFRDLRKLADLAMNTDPQFALQLLHQVLNQQTPEGKDYPNSLSQKNLSSLLKGLEAGMKVVRHLTARL